MKVQYQIILFVICLNLAFGLAFELGLPGTEYSQGQTPISAQEYQETFNATEVGKGWASNPFLGIPVIGDIFGGFQFLYKHIHFFIDGFGMFLNFVGDTFLVDSAGRAAFMLIADGFRALWAFLLVFLFIEFISGRYFSE